MLVSAALVSGVGLGAAGIASAATGSTSTTSPSASSGTTGPPAGSSGSPPANAPANPPAGDPAAMTHGPNETLLTGTDLQKADAAATAAVPGATIIRAETDSSGAAPYEVHMKKADGSYVTVQLSSKFTVIRTVSGFGPGPAGGQPPNGMAPPASGTTPPANGTAPSTSAA
jgi:hypothetical protein